MEKVSSSARRCEGREKQLTVGGGVEGAVACGNAIAITLEIAVAITARRAREAITRGSTLSSEVLKALRDIPTP
jgi:uncharacterized protein YggE